MSVVLEAEQVGPCRTQLKIEVPAPAVDAEYARVVEEYGRQARLPGFRKGKVPAAVVRQRFREDIEREVVERLVPRYWQQAEAERQLRTLGSPEVGHVHFHAGAPLTFVATVEVRPDIEVRNVRDFSLPEMATTVAAAEIAETLEDLRRGVAEWETVDRPAARGDLMIARVLPAAGEAPPAASEPVGFEVGAPAVWPELSLAATGLAAGQRSSFERAETDPPQAFSVEAIEVRQRRLPPLDDAFAAKVGNFSDLAALRSDIEARLGANKRLERRRRREQAVLDQLLERHPMPVPEHALEHEQQHLLRDYAERLAQRGVDLEKAEIDWQGLAAEVRPQAERRVKARLMLDAVADHETIAVDESELEAVLSSLARAEKTTSGAIRQALSKGGRLEGLRAQLRREKVMNRLLGEERTHGASAPESAGEG
jgi:trigger factor